MTHPEIGLDMGRTSIEPARVTRPFQLLAAWLAGLVLIDSLFLGAATQIAEPSWAAGTLVIAAIINTPVFLVCLFLLLTKFRPEMQEDQYYSTYIEKRYSRETQKLEPVPSRPAVAPARVPLRARKSFDFGKLSSGAEGDGVFIEDNLSLNDLIPNFKRIRNDLVKAGLTITSTFGSTSHDPSTPEKFVISIGHGADIRAVQEAVRVCMKYGLDGVAMAREDHDFGRIYVGAYSYDGGDTPYAPLTPDLQAQILSSDLTWAKLENLLKDTR